MTALGTKIAVFGVSTIGLISLLSGVFIHFRPQTTQVQESLRAEGSAGAIGGRMVQVDAREYRLAFKDATPKLGDCAMRKSEEIERCTARFEGEKVFIPKATTDIDVSRVQSSEDILSHIAGGIGVGVGVLGLASVSVKVNVAVTTKTSGKFMNLMSSYNVQRGVDTLKNAHPVTPIAPEGSLYLSEIALGGSETLIVTMEFESEAKKTEVEVTVKVKILFITITAKMKYIKEEFKSASSVRSTTKLLEACRYRGATCLQEHSMHVLSDIQFISSWRPHEDHNTTLDNAIVLVEKIEQKYLNGPTELLEMDLKSEKLHNFYSFASWNRGPYGDKLNLATVTADTDKLSQQNIEVKSVIDQIKSYSQMSMDKRKREEMVQLNKTVTDISIKLTRALDNYHTMTPEGRLELPNIYGRDKAPLHYQRKLNAIYK